MYHEYVAFVDKANEVVSSIGEVERKINERIFASEEDTREAKNCINKYSYVYGDLKYLIERMGFAIEKGNAKMFRKTMKNAVGSLENMQSSLDSFHTILSRMQTVDEYSAQQESFENSYDSRYYTEEDEERTYEYQAPNSSPPFFLNTSINLFFAGCNSVDAVEKRYKSLAKVYHPDMPTGDEETFKMMREEYEKVKGKINNS